LKLARTKEWRESHGLTQRELAAEAGVGEVTVARVETGASVTPPTARKIAEALGVAVADLLERPPVPLDKASAFHMDAETFNGLANLLRKHLAHVQPEELPYLVYEGIAVANWAAQHKRRDVDPLLDDALEEELAAAREVEIALSTIEDALYAISDEAKRHNAAIAAGVEDELAARRRRRKVG